MASDGGGRRQHIHAIGVASMQRPVRCFRPVYALREGVALDGPAVLDIRAAPNGMDLVGLGRCEADGCRAGGNFRRQNQSADACNRKPAPYNATWPISVHRMNPVILRHTYV